MLEREYIFTDLTVTKSCLSNFELDKIVELHEKEKDRSVQATVWDGEGISTNQNWRQSTLSWMDDDFFKRHQCDDIWLKIINQVNDMNEQHYVFDLIQCEPFQVTKYDSSNQDFYNGHVDCYNKNKGFDRKLSFIIQLSNPSEFDGGEFIYYGSGNAVNMSKNHPEIMNKGNMIAFPSFIPHAVSPVTRGTRYSLVGWCSGPRFK